MCNVAASIPNRIFHKTELFLFRIALLILFIFIIGLIKVIRAELGW